MTINGQDERQQKINNLSLEWQNRETLEELERELVEIVGELLRENISLDDAVVTLRGGSFYNLYDLSPVDIGIEVVHGIVDTPLISDRLYRYNYLERLILIGLSGFTNEAIQSIDRFQPAKVELIDFPRLQAWASGIDKDKAESEAKSLYAIVESFSRKLVELVAYNTDALECLEWRDVERLLAEACAGLGFTVELTPPAKDGGKDIILQCWMWGQKRKYFVEVKHWSNRVGHGVVRDFLRVIVDDHADKGLILATTGYTQSAFEQLTEMEKRQVRGGDKTKTIALCQMYTRIKSGLYVASTELPDLLFTDTLPREQRL